MTKSLKFLFSILLTITCCIYSSFVVKAESTTLNVPQSPVYIAIGDEYVLDVGGGQDNEILDVQYDNNCSNIFTFDVTKNGVNTITITGQQAGSGRIKITDKTENAYFVDVAVGKAVENLRVYSSNYPIVLNNDGSYSYGSINVSTQPSESFYTSKTNYVSDDESVLVVNQYGSITPLKQGTANVICTTTDYLTNQQYTNSVKLKVLQGEYAIRFNDSVSINMKSTDAEIDLNEYLKKYMEPSNSTFEDEMIAYSLRTESSTNVIDHASIKSGKIKPLQNGSAEIVAQLVCGNMTSINVSILGSVNSMKFDDENIGIKLYSDSGSVNLTSHLKFDPEYLNGQLNASDITWSSSDESVGHFDKNGILQLSKEGTIRVEAKYAGHTASANVIAYKDDVVPDDVSVKNSLKAYEGVIVPLKYTPMPGYAIKGLKATVTKGEDVIGFGENNPASEVPMDCNGVSYLEVYGKKKGNAEITITCSENPAIHKVVNVTVTDEIPPFEFSISELDTQGNRISLKESNVYDLKQGKRYHVSGKFLYGGIDGMFASVVCESFNDRSKGFSATGGWGMANGIAGQQQYELDLQAVQAGTFTIEVAPKVKKTFRIKDGLVRFSGATRYDTMDILTTDAYSENDEIDSMIVCSGLNYPDALAASSLAGKNVPILLTDPNVLSEQTKKQIQRLKPKNIYVIGGTSAVSNIVFSKLNALVTNVQRISGETRYDTALEIMDTCYTLNGSSNTAIIATGTNFADALSISSYSSNTNSPIILSDPVSGLSSDALAKIKEYGYSNILIVGGANAVPKKVEQQLRGINCSSIVRLSGETRYDTSVQIAKYVVAHGLSMDNVMIATGENFPDALSAGPIAGSRNSVVLLTNGGSVTEDYLKQYKGKINKAYIVGGENAVNDSNAKKLSASIGLNY